MAIRAPSELTKCIQIVFQSVLFRVCGIGDILIGKRVEMVEAAEGKLFCSSDIQMLYRNTKLLNIEIQKYTNKEIQNKRNKKRKKYYNTKKVGGGRQWGELFCSRSKDWAAAAANAK